MQTYQKLRLLSHLLMNDALVMSCEYSKWSDSVCQKACTCETKLHFVQYNMKAELQTCYLQVVGSNPTLAAIAGERYARSVRFEDRLRLYKAPLSWKARRLFKLILRLGYKYSSCYP